MGDRDPGERVAVGDRHRLDAQRLRGDEQLLDVAGAAQEGVVRGDLQLGIAGHGAHLRLVRMEMLAGARRDG